MWRDQIRASAGAGWTLTLDRGGKCWEMPLSYSELMLTCDDNDDDVHDYVILPHGNLGVKWTESIAATARQ